MSTRHVEGAEPPVDHTKLRVEAPHEVAAGVPAVLQTARHALRRLGGRDTIRLLHEVNQHDGFDCPSCAWPDPRHRSYAEFCENGAKAVADAGTSARATPATFAEWSLTALRAQPDRFVNELGRITEPLIRRPGHDHYEPIGWDDAFDVVAEHLVGLDHPDQASFYTSGRTSNEAAFLYQLFVRAFGTNNLPDCSNMCHESSGAALGASIGIGKGTVLLDDFDRAELILVMGQNPGTNHPRMLTALQQAVESGAEIVSINPLFETGLRSVRNPQDFAQGYRRPLRAMKAAVHATPLASTHLPVRIGGDLALMTGVVKTLIATGGVARDFVDERTSGFADLAAHVATVGWDLIVDESGIPRADIEALAAKIAATDKIIICWAMGLTQHGHAVATLRQVANVALLRGAIGKPGAGLCPVRGHSNVQGDRTVGIWEKMPDAFLDRLGQRFSFSPPREHGHDTVNTIRALHDGRVRVLMCMGGNLLGAAPDTHFTAEALERADLTVHVSTHPNRAHLVPGATSLILPCLTRTERDEQASGPQFVTVENSMGIVTRSQGKSTPASPSLRSEPAIVAGIAKATLGRIPGAPAIDWDHLVADHDHVRDAIEDVVDGFDGYNVNVRRPGGFALPNPPREGRFELPGGRAQLAVLDIPVTELADRELVMMTIRSHDQFNTTIYGDDDRYRGILGGRRVVLVNADDLADRGLVTGDLVDLVSRDQGVERRADQFACVAYDIPRGCVATYFPEANAIIPIDRVAKGSNTPSSKWVPVTLDAIGAHIDIEG